MSELQTVNLLKWDSTSAVLVGLAAFQLADYWTKTAPTLAEMRASEPGDVTTRQKLLDAEMQVGTLAAVIGVVITVLTRDPSALVIMLGVFAALAGWHHAVLQADPR